MNNDYCYTQRQRDYEREMREQERDGWDDEEETDDSPDPAFSSWRQAEEQFYRL